MGQSLEEERFRLAAALQAASLWQSGTSKATTPRGPCGYLPLASEGVSWHAHANTHTLKMTSKQTYTQSSQTHSTHMDRYTTHTHKKKRFTHTAGAHTHTHTHTRHAKRRTRIIALRLPVQLLFTLPSSLPFWLSEAIFCS